MGTLGALLAVNLLAGTPLLRYIAHVAQMGRWDGHVKQTKEEADAVRRACNDNKNAAIVDERETERLRKRQERRIRADPSPLPPVTNVPPPPRPPKHPRSESTPPAKGDNSPASQRQKGGGAGAAPDHQLQVPSPRSPRTSATGQGARGGRGGWRALPLDDHGQGAVDEYNAAALAVDPSVIAGLLQKK